MNKTLEYTPAELVWILTALEKANPATYMWFKDQFYSDLYWVQLEISTYAVLRTKLADVRRTFTHLLFNAGEIKVDNIEDTTTYLVQSLDSIIVKVEALFNV